MEGLRDADIAAQTSGGRPTIAYVWRSRTRPERAEKDEAYYLRGRIRPPVEKALRRRLRRIVEGCSVNSFAVDCWSPASRFQPSRTSLTMRGWSAPRQLLWSTATALTNSAIRC